MSDTPRTDAAVSPTALLHRSDGTYSEIVFAVFARQLERELAAAQAEIATLRVNAKKWRSYEMSKNQANKECGK